MSKLSMTIPRGTTRVFHTAGTYCDRDIVVTAENGDGYDKGYEDGANEAIANIPVYTGEAEDFTFLHFGVEEIYRAEEGMTWGEWLESEYNTGSYGSQITTDEAYGYPDFLTANDRWIADGDTGIPVRTSELIYADIGYIWRDRYE